MCERKRKGECVYVCEIGRQSDVYERERVCV